MTDETAKPFLYLVVCAAGIAAGVGKLITAAQERGWEVGIIATPVAMNGFFDTAEAEARTGRPIRSAWRRPADPRPFPPPDAVAVAPATFNTVNKWGRRTRRHPGRRHPVRGPRSGRPDRRAALRRGRPVRPPRLPGEPGPAARTGVRFGDPYAGEPEADGGRPEFAWTRVLDLLERD